jgi:hypothetical protein
MHRIERVELDLPDGNLPSLSQRFLNKTGLAPSVVLSPKDHSPEQVTTERRPSTPQVVKERS